MRNAGFLRIFAHRLVAVHVGHHDVHEHHAQVGRALDDLDGLAAVGRADHLHVVVLEQRGQGEDVARVVVDHQHFAAAQDLVRAVQPLEHRLLLRRQVGDHAVQEQRRLVQQPLGRLHVLEDDALGHRLELGLLVGAQVLAGEDDDRHVRQRRLGVHLLQQLEAGHVGQAQVEHDAVEGPVAHRLPAPRRRWPP